MHKVLSSIKYEDVTKEWLNKPSSNIHKVIIDKKYIDVNGIKHPIKNKEKSHITLKESNEYKMSEWLVHTFGGEIHNVPRITDVNNNKSSVHTPDYLWNKERWELKTPNPIDKTSNVIEAFAKRKKSKLQANKFIVDISNTRLSKRKAYNYTLETMNKRRWLNKIILIKNNKVLFVILRK